MKPSLILACDPGWSGSFVRIDDGDCLHCLKMPDDIPGVVQALQTARRFTQALYIEEVGGFIGGRGGQPGSAMFKFGQNTGAVLAAAHALGFEIRRIHPKKWQKAHALGTKGSMTDSQWKNKLKARAMEIFPKANITLAYADAALILDAARRGLI